MKNFELYRRVYLIRKAEEAIIERYMQDEMKTPVHLSIGQEAISAGVTYALEKTDQLVGTYRSHGIYLSRTLETDRFFGELYGRVTGVAKGKAGSMHLSSAEHGFLGSSAVVGTHIPVGAGAALANKLRGGKEVVAAFFGDGAIDEGVFFETLNFAALRRLRMLFVCEDNGLAIHAHAAERHGYDNIEDIARQFHCDVYSSDSTVAAELYDLTARALLQVRETGRPAFMHLKYYRYLEHVGINEDFKFGYRSRADLELWQARDPVAVQRPLAVRETSIAEVEALERGIDRQILDSIAAAEAAPFPSPDELYTDVMP
jgi:pyruvate dehydrogenase E1 component alpha subunit